MRKIHLALRVALTLSALFLSWSTFAFDPISNTADAQKGLIPGLSVTTTGTKWGYSYNCGWSTHNWMAYYRITDGRMNRFPICLRCE